MIAIAHMSLCGTNLLCGYEHGSSVGAWSFQGMVDNIIG
jgi:hypothetical protein